MAQWLYPVPSGLRGALLVELLQNGSMDDALVFTRTKHRADRVCKLLNRNGISAERIHGNRSQAQRTEALADFKSGKCRVLVATDIAARGIDVEALGHVVNFDVPAVPEDYIHRVGRTARADATGDAITLVSPEDEGDLARIERALGSKLPRVRVEGFAYEAAPAGAPGGAPRRAHRRDPGPEGGGSQPRGREGGGQDEGGGRGLELAAPPEAVRTGAPGLEGRGREERHLSSDAGLSGLGSFRTQPDSTPPRV